MNSSDHASVEWIRKGASHDAMERLGLNFDQIVEAFPEYLASIDASGIPYASVRNLRFSVDDGGGKFVCFEQKFYHGILLSDWLLGNGVNKPSWSESCKVFGILIGYVEALSNSSPAARIDTNIRNFVLAVNENSTKLVLVDVFPPLIAHLTFSSSAAFAFAYRRLAFSYSEQVLAVIVHWIDLYCNEGVVPDLMRRRTLDLLDVAGSILNRKKWFRRAIQKLARPMSFVQFSDLHLERVRNLTRVRVGVVAGRAPALSMRSLALLSGWVDQVSVLRACFRMPHCTEYNRFKEIMHMSLPFLRVQCAVDPEVQAQVARYFNLFLHERWGGASSSVVRTISLIFDRDLYLRARHCCRIEQVGVGVQTFKGEWQRQIDVGMFKVYIPESEKFSLPVLTCASESHISLVVGGTALDGARALLRTVRELSMRYSERAGSAVFHSASAVFAELGGAILMAGPKGSGKTTALLKVLPFSQGYIGNDRVIVDGNLNLHYVPLPLRVAQSTAVEAKWLGLNCERVDAFEVGADSKMTIPPSFLEQRGVTLCVSPVRCVALIFPHITFDGDDDAVIVEELSCEATLGEIKKSCFTPNEESWLSNWLVARFRAKSLRDASEICEALALQCSGFSVKYGPRAKGDVILSKIRERLAVRQ